MTFFAVFYIIIGNTVKERTMKAENLLSAYRALTKRKYTTRARLADECDFSLMSATNAARILISLGLVREWKPSGEGKLFANDIYARIGALS